MQINKKVFTIAITALLLLSMLAVAAPAFAAPGYAIQVNSTTPSTGTVGQKVTIAGSAASAGGVIQIYWENLASQLLNTTTADGLGNFTVTANIPDAVAGNHFLIILDASTGTTIGTSFTITPKITLSPAIGLPGDAITVTGSGFNGTTGARNVTINFSNSTGTTQYSQTVAAVNATSTGNFSITFTVPAVDYGAYNVNATDQSLPTPNIATAAFTVSATITISPASGPSGTIVTITGRGFNSTAGASITVSIGTTGPVKRVAPIATVTGGTFTGQFIVPTLATGNYSITAADGTVPGISVLPSANGFKVTRTTSVTATPTSSGPGSTITLTGTGFTAISGTSVTVRFGATAAGTFILATFTIADASGNFTGPISIPNLPTAGYFINGTDNNALNATTTFNIAITALFVTPTSGPAGSVVTLTGFGFGLTGGTTFNVTLGPYLLTPSSNSVTNLNAGTAQITIPTIPVGTYTVTVTDNVGLTNTAQFAVTATSTLTVNPSTAPVGVTGVALTVSGFGASSTVNFFITNATFSTALTVSPVAPFTTLVTNTSGILTASFTVPSLNLGTYSIIANESTGQWNATAVFAIGAATLNINTRASTYVQGTILSFNIQSTFATSFNINVYDPAGTQSQVVIQSALFFPIGALQVYPYSVGQGSGWSQGAQFILPIDAVTGTWTWNASVVLGASTVVKTGTFTVVADVTNTDLSNKINALNQTIQAIQTNTGTIITNLASINAVITTINGNTATLSSSIGTLTTSVNSLSSSISGISGSLASITTSLGTVTTSLNSIVATITSISSDTATIKTTVGTISTSLSSIGATVTTIQGNVATIQTSLGTLSGTVTSISGDTATIKTSLGTMQADISALQTSVNGVQSSVGNVQTAVGTLQTDVTSTKSTSESLSPLIIVAIVLALVAAIAAIASIVLMRRKIAG